MGTEKRERKKANRAAKVEAEHAAEARRRRRRFIRNAVILVIAIIVVGMLLGGCSSSEDTGSEGAAKTTTTTGDASAPDAKDAKASYSTGACPPEATPDPPKIDFTTAPEKCIEDGTTYRAEIVTSEGTVMVDFDTLDTPITANNFIALARNGYYDDTTIFRTEAQSGIIQGGSPHTQDNSDPGPGYTIPDEGLPYTADDYGPGTLAMARTAAPNSASGQFFFLANEGGRYLGDQAQLGESAGSYVPFATVTEGLDVLVKIAALDDGSSTPSTPVTIKKITITEA